MISDNNNIYIISEYCNGGTFKKFIDDYIDKLTEREIKFYMTQIKDALQYLISFNVYHRDIKPHNIFLSYKKNGKNKIKYNDIILKIGDFGFAKEIGEDNMLDTLCGTPIYMAPEILFEKKYYEKSDLWSVGIIFFELIYNKYPFGNPKNIIELMKNINSIPLSFSYSCDSDELLISLLEKDPIKRISWSDFFNHKWFVVTPVETPVEKEKIIDNEDNTINYNQLKSTMTNKLKTQQPINIIRKIDIIENYYDQFSSSAPTSSSIPIQLKKKDNNKFNYGSYTDNIYKYITSSIENIRSHLM
jgi:serine/threonine protein kinase